MHGSSYIFLYMKMSPGLSRHHLAEGARFSKLPVRCQFYVLRHEKGIGRECNVIVCVLGSDLMWLQHILMSNSWTSRCPSCDQPLLPCWKVWTWCFWQSFGRGDWGLVVRWDFFLHVMVGGDGGVVRSKKLVQVFKQFFFSRSSTRVISFGRPIQKREKQKNFA